MQEFRYGKVMKIFLFLICAGFIVGFGYGLFQFEDERPATFFGLILPTFLALISLGVYGIMDLSVGSFVISSDRVTLRSPFGSRMLMLDEIRGFRVDDNYIRIIPLNPKQKKLKITRYFKDSLHIVYWLSDHYNNLDVVEGAEDEHEVLENEAIGITRESREDKLKEARRVARIVNGGAWLLLIWLSAIKPYREYGIVLCSIYPLIAIFVTLHYRGIMTPDDYEDTKLPSVGIAMILPGILLALRALLDYNVIAYPPFIWGVMAFISIATAIMYTMPSFKSSTKPWRFYGAGALMIFLNFFYSYGVVVTANCMLDRSTPKQHTTTVAGKSVSNGKITTYKVKLNPWSNHTEVEEAHVTREEYEFLQQGDSVIVKEHDGLLRLPWIEVET